ncbi:DUF563 domain-containing protein [Ammoniphilus sp. 3BR4]|uniref:glycosyltransferase family 61 protein n=1 Tax=Ammoniphilus sp. 3BR4 TaxID=3158265 RepID=UPI0034652AEC
MSNYLKPPDGVYHSASEWVEKTSSKKFSPTYIEFEPVIPTNFPKAKGIDGRHFANPFASEKPLPRRYVVVIPEGRVWGRTGSVITPDNKLLWDVSWQPSKSPSNHSIFRQKKLPPAVYTKESVAVLTFCVPNNYFHWMFDVISRLDFLRRSRINFNKYVINRISPQPFHQQILDLLGIPKEKIIECNNHFHLQAKRLVVPSRKGFISKEACDFLRNELLSKRIIKKSDLSKRIYVSRKNASVRKILNEDQVIGVLEEYGFRTVYLEKMTVAEQIGLFSSSSAVIAPHGAGLTNLVFCHKGTKVIETFPRDFVPEYYWKISALMNLDYYYLIGDVVKRDTQQKRENDILIPIEKLKKIIEMTGMEKN